MCFFLHQCNLFQIRGGSGASPVAALIGRSIEDARKWQLFRFNKEMLHTIPNIYRSVDVVKHRYINVYDDDAI